MQFNTLAFASRNGFRQIGEHSLKLADDKRSISVYIDHELRAVVPREGFDDLFQQYPGAEEAFFPAPPVQPQEAPALGGEA